MWKKYSENQEDCYFVPSLPPVNLVVYSLKILVPPVTPFSRPRKILLWTEDKAPKINTKSMLTNLLILWLSNRNISHCPWLPTFPNERIQVYIYI